MLIKRSNFSSDKKAHVLGFLASSFVELQFASREPKDSNYNSDGSGIEAKRTF